MNKTNAVEVRIPAVSPRIVSLRRYKCALGKEQLLFSDMGAFQGLISRSRVATAKGPTQTPALSEIENAIIADYARRTSTTPLLCAFIIPLFVFLCTEDPDRRSPET